VAKFGRRRINMMDGQVVDPGEVKRRVSARYQAAGVEGGLEK
jgi:hypothetical protein